MGWGTESTAGPAAAAAAAAETDRLRCSAGSACGAAHRQTDRQTDTQTDRQTDRHKHTTHTHTSFIGFRERRVFREVIASRSLAVALMSQLTRAQEARFGK